MARRTKAEAEATREALLDAAEQVFYDKGVARASLQEIARAAGVTRGAFYWHFSDKAALFRAMLDRVRLPFEELVETIAKPQPAPNTLETLRLVALAALEHAERPRLRRVHAIIIHRCEIFDDINPVAMVREIAETAFTDTLNYFEQAQRAGELRVGLDARTANWLFHSNMRGLIYSWHLDPDAFSLTETGSTLFDWLFATFADLQPPEVANDERRSVSRQRPRG